MLFFKRESEKSDIENNIITLYHIIQSHFPSELAELEDQYYNPSKIDLTFDGTLEPSIQWKINGEDLADKHTGITAAVAAEWGESLNIPYYIGGLISSTLTSVPLQSPTPSSSDSTLT